MGVTAISGLCEGPIIPCGTEVNFNPISEDQGRVHQFGTKVLPGRFIGYALNAEGSWTGDLVKVDTKNMQTIPPSEIHAKRFKSKEWTFKTETEFVFPCRTGEILHEGQPLSAALYKAGGDFRRDYWNTVGDTSLSEPWIGVTRFELLNKDPPEGQRWVQGRLTKKQVTAGPGLIWQEDWSSTMSRSSQGKAINQWAEDKNKVGRSERATMQPLCSGRRACP